MKSMRLTAAGDALMVKRMPRDYPGFEALSAFIRQGEARLTNLETTLTHRPTCASAYSGGTWLTARPEILEDLVQYGFNCVGFSNNHALDYSYGGLAQTLSALEEAKLAHPGAGENLYQAAKPAPLALPRAQVGVIAICSTFENAARAGHQSGSLPGRPGLNPLRYKSVYRLNARHMAALREIAQASGINGRNEVLVAQGFRAPAPKGRFEFGGILFEESENEGRFSFADPRDVARTVDSIKDALLTMDYVVVMVHSHEVKCASDEEADYFLEEFAHACIEAGASAVIGSGTHQLKAVELYQGRPILYSLGNFIFQNEYVETLPPEFMEQYGLPLDTPASRAIAHRTALSSASLYDNPFAYRTVVPLMEFEGDALQRLRLLPVSLGEKLDRHLANWPRPADEAETRQIFEYLSRVSAGYGTALSQNPDGTIEVCLGR